MTPRTRKLAGTIALIAMITIYAFIALAVAVVLQVSNTSKIGELAFYVIAGLLWVLPAGVLIKWMQKPDS
jgi:peptidoglycan/LPS O-acetylase OafA/YrhL